MSVLAIQHRHDTLLATSVARRSEGRHLGPRQPLRLALVSPRRTVLPELQVLTGRVAPPDGRRSHRQRADSVIMTLSQHSAAVETVVHPPLARLVGGKPFVVEDRQLNHTVALQLRRLRGALEGDAFAASISPTGVAQRISGLLAEQAHLRSEWVGRLEDELSDAEQWQLAERLSGAVRRSPTRPHPYSPRSGLLGRAARQFWTPVDRAMDVMDNRSMQSVA